MQSYVCAECVLIAICAFRFGTLPTSVLHVEISDCMQFSMYMYHTLLP